LPFGTKVLSTRVAAVTDKTTNVHPRGRTELRVYRRPATAIISCAS
jgi:hypothetical protein